MVDDVDKSKRVRKVKKVEEGGKATSKATTSKPKRKKARKKRVPKKEVNEIVVPWTSKIVSCSGNIWQVLMTLISPRFS